MLLVGATGAFPAVVTAVPKLPPLAPAAPHAAPFAWRMHHSAVVAPTIPMGAPTDLGAKEASGLPKGGPSASSRPGTIHARFVAWLDRGGKYFVVLAWLAILVVGIVGVVRVFPSLKLSVRRLSGHWSATPHCLPAHSALTGVTVACLSLHFLTAPTD